MFIKERKPYVVWVDERARDTPDRPYAITPRSEKLDDGYVSLTYAQLAKAVDRMSWWLDQKLGKASSFDVVAYIGSNDLRYAFLYFAALKTRRQVLFPLNQNTKQAHLNLLENTGCRILVASDEISTWDTLRPEADDFTFLKMPPFKYFAAEEPADHYPYTRTWDEIKDESILIMHTSGTTGLPKPVRLTSYMMSLFNTGFLPTMFSSLKTVIPLPPSWILGIFFHVNMPIESGVIPILLPSDAPMPMTAPYMDALHVQTHADAGVYVPFVLKGLVKNPTYLEHMRHMKAIGWGGAALDHKTGDILAKFPNVKLQAIMGSTEVGSYGLRGTAKEDWMWYNFDPSTGFQFWPFQDDLFESVIVRHKDPEEARTQMIFHVFPDLDVYRTKDVWRENTDPKKKGLWLYCGRTDDFVKLNTLTKFNATHVEGLIMKNPEVRACVMGGDGREVPFLIVEMNEDVEDQAAKKSIWSLVQSINGQISSMISVEKEMIMLAKREKPIKRVAGKGTVNRRATVEEYAAEIDQLYCQRRLE